MTQLRHGELLTTVDEYQRKVTGLLDGNKGLRVAGCKTDMMFNVDGRK